MAYTNSSLISYTRLSPNHSGLRTHAIDRITIHHMGGNLTVEQCGNVFAPTSRQASSNYGIGTDGRIALYVPEAYRAWTSSSAANDQRAITIEVANSKCAEPWPVSDKAMASLIKLCADICKRNGIKKLNYTGDTSGNMTLHKWFAPTGCPGTYLSGKMKYIQDEVNKILTKKTVTKPGVAYRVRTQKHGWLPAVKNLEDYAGYEESPITDVAIKPSKGVVKYRVHLTGGQWQPWVKSSDYSLSKANGHAGCKKPINAIQMKYVNEKGKSFKIKYRIAPVNGKYYSWQTDVLKTDGMKGYTGLKGIKIGKLQITIV